MNRKVLAALLFVAIGSATAAERAKSKAPVSSDIQRAIAWEKHKDAAAARQARIEARHPTVTYNNNADRSADRSAPDPGEPQVQKNTHKDQ
jgi:hypothetical protein